MAESNMSKQRPTKAVPPRSVAPAPSAAKPARTAAPKAVEPKAVEQKGLESAFERLEASVASLKRERDALAAELAAAKIEIATLDAARKSAIDRIDWVIDSLNTVLQDNS
jgi:septal ring factor EnvC (AmiA/AmiB activator)